jgi:hypothetical protein
MDLQWVAVASASWADAGGAPPSERSSMGSAVVDGASGGGQFLLLFGGATSSAGGSKLLCPRFSQVERSNFEVVLGSYASYSASLRGPYSGLLALLDILICSKSGYVSCPSTRACDSDEN